MDYTRNNVGLEFGCKLWSYRIPQFRHEVDNVVAKNGIDIGILEGELGRQYFHRRCKCEIDKDIGSKMVETYRKNIQNIQIKNRLIPRFYLQKKEFEKALLKVIRRAFFLSKIRLLGDIKKSYAEEGLKG